MNRVWQIALIGVVGTMMASCIADVDGTSVPPAHDCADDISQAGNWSAAGLTLYHNDPKTCPVHLVEQGEYLDVYGTVESTSSNAWYTELEVLRGPTGTVRLASDVQYFTQDPYTQKWVVLLGFYFPASSWGESADKLKWKVQYNGPGFPWPEYHAQLILEYTTDSCPQGKCRDMWL